MAGAANQVVDIRRGVLQRVAVGLGAFLTDEQVRVGFLVADGRKREYAHFEILFEEQGEGPFGCGLSGRVRVVIHDHALGEAAEEPDLRLGQACAAARHNVADARSRNGDRVHVALDQDREVLPADSVFCTIHVVEDVAFRIDARFRRIQVLGLLTPKRPAAKCDDLAGLVRDGKRDTPPEAIE